MSHEVQFGATDKSDTQSLLEITVPSYDRCEGCESFYDPHLHRDASWLMEDLRPDEEFVWIEPMSTVPKVQMIIKRELCTTGLHVIAGAYDLSNIQCDLMSHSSSVTDFVPAPAYGLFVSEAFRPRLEQSRLTGYEFHRQEVLPNILAKEPLPIIFITEVTGRILEAPFRVVGVPNECPNCGHGPIVCSACSHIDEICPKCGKQAVRPPGRNLFPESRPLLRAPVPKAGRPLLGRTWNGQDFVRTISDVSEFNFTERYYITRRALDWLQRVHARPYYARPAQVILDGMTDEQLGWLDRANGPSPDGLPD